MTVRPLPHVRRAIVSQGRKFSWVAKRVGISQGHLTRILAGERPLSAAQAQLLADALGLPVEYILPAPEGADASQTEPMEAGV